ncbi:fumarate hydratase, partial [Streptomyces sp. NPDC005568]
MANSGKVDWSQFGGKYFCHDVRVVRLPRHGASCPVA